MKSDSKVLIVLLVLCVILSGGIGYYLCNIKMIRLQHKENAKYNQMIDELKDTIRSNEIAHSKETIRINNELSKAQASYNASLISIESDYRNRLQSSNQRAEVYKRKSEAGATECRSLADYTTRLDQTLEEGRTLVREFGATLRQRDEQLRLLGQQMLSDRKLFNGSSNE